MARKSNRDRGSCKWAIATILAFAASAPIVDASKIASSATSSAVHAHPTLDPTVSISQAIYKAHSSWPSSLKDKVFGSVANFLSYAIPDPSYFSYDLDQFDDMRDVDGLPSGSGTSDGAGAGLNWGGSTLEVVRSQAIFLTRSAAFGPRIVNDEGLRGFLQPISDFYHLPGASDALPSQACPHEGGPGWRSQSYLSKYEEDDRRLYSRLGHQSHHSVPFTWTHTYNDSMPKPPKNWIALVERGGGCGFAAKIRVAQDLGAIAVVVGDASNPNWHGGKTGDPNEEGDPGLSGKRLITMFAPGDTSDVTIPSTFVTRPTFLDLERLIEDTEKDEEDWRKEHSDQHAPRSTRGLEIVIGKDDTVWEWPLIDLGILLLLLPSFMTVFTIIVHRVRLIRQRRKERAPQLVVLSLPCLIWRSNGQAWEKIEGPDTDPGPGNGGASSEAEQSAPATVPHADDLEAGMTREDIPLLQEDENGAGPSKVPPLTTTRLPASFLPPGRTYFSTDECAICLSDFVDGDRVRILPCGHIFHRQEIDDWLVRVKKLCPICKRDITVPIPPTPPFVSTASPTGAPPTDQSTVQSTDTIVPTTLLVDDTADDLTHHLSQDAEDTPSLPTGRQV